VKKINVTYNQKIPTFKAQFSLIAFVVFYLIIIIIGIAAGAEENFAVAIFYLGGFSYLGALISTLICNVSLIKLRRITI